MKSVKEVIAETLKADASLVPEKCEQLAEELTRKLGMERTKIIEGKDYLPSLTVLANFLDTIPNSPFVVGEVEEEREERKFADLAKKIGGKEIPLKTKV